MDRGRGRASASDGSRPPRDDSLDGRGRRPGSIRTAGIDPEDIDVIILATLTPDYWMPSTAALVKEAIGNTKAAAIDVRRPAPGFVYAYARPRRTSRPGSRHVLVIGAELLTRFLDYTDWWTCILFGDGAGAVVVSASDEPTPPVGIEMTTEPQGAYMIWLPAGGAKSPPSAETIARGEHYIPEGIARPTGSRRGRWRRHPRRRSRKAGLSAGRHLAVDPPPGEHPDHRGGRQGPRPADVEVLREPRQVRQHVGGFRSHRPRRGGERGAGRGGRPIVMVAFGAGFTSGAIAMEWTADPTRGPAGDAAVGPADVLVRPPVDWDSVDPTRSALAEIRQRPRRASRSRSTTSSRANRSARSTPSAEPRSGPRVILRWLIVAAYTLASPAPAHIERGIHARSFGDLSMRRMLSRVSESGGTQVGEDR